MPLKPIVILYHANCLDGFGSAYSAWKKFGDNASYIPVKHSEPPPDGLDGKELYIADFSYPKENLLAIEKNAKRLVVLDHHISAKEAVESIKEHVFDIERSGTGISWSYFHSDPMPSLLSYVQDLDLWKFTQPHAREISNFLSSLQFDFVEWDQLVRDFETQEGFSKSLDKGKTIGEYSKFLLETFSKDVYAVEFEGYHVRAVNVPNYFASSTGNFLAEKYPPFAITWYQNEKWFQFSLRGNGEVDLSVLAKKYGGGGHHDAAGFKLPLESQFPFKRI